MKKITSVVILYIILYTLYLILPLAVQAEYVLPYPSSMPGNKIYKITRLVDWLKNYWYWGDIAQAKYHLMLSDKYLVEAKILFEYKQYLLGDEALVRSSNEWQQIQPHLNFAKNHNKDITKLFILYKEAAQVHEIVLRSFIVPESILWNPEKGTSTNLYLKEDITKAIEIRKQ